MEEQDSAESAEVTVFENLQKLLHVPKSVHLLCPKQTDDDNTDYYALEQADSSEFDELDRSQVAKIIKEAEERRNVVIECFRIYAFEGEDALREQARLDERLNHVLQNCNECITNYYVGKRRLLRKLHDEYEDDQVQAFAEVFDEREIGRIVPQLGRVMHVLRALPTSSRRFAALDRNGVMAISESLCCDALLKQDSLLREHFDEAFKMLQGKKGLGVIEFVPATTRFLFDPNPDRCGWARRVWRKYARSPTRDQFDWAMKDALVENLQKASLSDVTPSVVQQLWCGLQLIMEKLNSDLITHSLRALDQDFCRLLLEHFHVRTTGLGFMLHTFRSLLVKAPGVFWDSMGTISPTTVVEQIFNNPQFDDFLLEAKEGEPSERSALNDILGWIDPFMKSLQSANQPDACQSLLFQLLDRLQNNRFPDNARSHCYRVGVSVLHCMIDTFAKSSPPQESVARVVLSSIGEIVASYADSILDAPSYVHTAHQTDPDKLPLHIEIVTRILEFDCICLKKDFDLIRSNESLDHSIIKGSTGVWTSVVSRLRKVEDLVLAKGALLAFIPLVGLERFRSKIGVADGSKSHFNQVSERIAGFVGEILDKISEFAPENLDELLKVSDTATSLISSLLSAEASVSQGAVEVIKNVSGQSGRKEAISHLFQAFFATPINAFGFAFRRITNLKTFSPTPLMVRTGTDIIDVLCDPRNGILRTRLLADRRDVVAIENLWAYFWEALRNTFTEMEQWSTDDTGLGKAANMDFCRDTMQLAESLFTSYDVFAGALGSAKNRDPEKPEKVSPKESLLRYPAYALGSMVYWLRFRDEYLATTSVNLVLLILRRLGELGLKVASHTLTNIEDMCVKDSRTGKIPVKTNLTPNQKAELCRALETYSGRTLVEKRHGHQKERPKQSTLSTWTKSASGKGPESESSLHDVSDDFGDSEILDEDILEVSRSAELVKFQASTRNKDTPVIPKPIKKPFVDVVTFREKREKEKEEKKKRDAIEIARQKRNQVLLTGVEDRTSKKTGLGAQGKDHQDGNLMVSSSSESEDEETISTFGPPIKRQNVDAKNGSSADRLLATQGPVKKIKVNRSAKDMRARLAPDLSVLHKTILSWDFFSESDVPPSSTQEDYSLVSSVFRTPSEYHRTFEPLLILEAWQGFRKDKEEGNFKSFLIKVASRLSVDSFIEVSTSMAISQGQELGLGESDVVLISSSKNPATDSTQPHCLSRISRVVRKGGEMQISYRVNTNNPLLASLSPNTELWGAKISSLIPLEREYGALTALQFYDLCEEIIKAKPSPIIQWPDKLIAPLVKNYEVNQAQAKAVKSALENDAFTLIQGPPGSGKTKTIVALVGALLTNSLANRAVAIPRPAGTNGATGSPLPKKLLVCAPSNAAVDELVMRLKQGVKTLNGRIEKLSVVRLGRSDAINANVKDVTLDELLQAKLNAVASDTKRRTTHDIMMEHKATAEKVNQIRAKMDELMSKGQSVMAEVEREFELLKRKKGQLGAEIDASRDKDNSVNRDSEVTRRKMQQEILDGAHVLCATLSGSGHDMFRNLSIEFETVIIDEAAQSIELSALIPLKYGCSKCILVGDPKQLPPTVLSREAAKFQYEQSLFVRMQTNHPQDVHLLDTQYRMHPEISRFPSKTFYESKLQDGPGMAALRARPWHQSDILGPYRFFDVQGSHQSAPKGHSLINIAEVNVALRLYGRLIKDCRGYDFNGKIGIITPYKSQLKQLKNRFQETHGKDILNKIDFNTTDAFQGRESEIIIFSCVRASPGGIGFLSDIRRMNVGLTRAKCSLWVLGNAQSLSRGEYWNALLEDSRSRNLFTAGDVLRLFDRPLLILDVEMTDQPSADVITIGSSSSSANPSPINAPKGPASSRQSSKGTTPRDSPAADYRCSQDLLPVKDVLPPSKSVPTFQDLGGQGKEISTGPRAIPTGPRAQNGASFGGNNVPPRPSTKREEANTSSLPSKTHLSLASPSELTSTQTGRPGATDRPTGASGGRLMIDENRACPICGSANHYAWDCDHEEAKIMTMGHCLRCENPHHYHPWYECQAVRCVECGNFGHRAQECHSSKKLPKSQKERVKKMEHSFAAKKEAWPAKLSRKNLGEHDRKVPVVLSTSEEDSKFTALNQKRKRGLSPRNDGTKAAKLSEGEKSMSSKDVKSVVHGKADEERGGGLTIRPSAGPAAMRPSVRPFRKKKDVDPFIRPKRVPKST